MESFTLDKEVSNGLNTYHYIHFYDLKFAIFPIKLYNGKVTWLKWYYQYYKLQTRVTYWNYIQMPRIASPNGYRKLSIQEAMIEKLKG